MRLAPRATGLGVALVLSMSGCGKPVNDRATVMPGMRETPQLRIARKCGRKPGMK